MKMNKNWLIGALLALALAVPAVGFAHEGHTHKVMGTVSSVKGNQVEIKTADGKTVIVTLGAKTTVTRGTAKLDATAVKPGDRVSIDATQEKDVVTAQVVKLGAIAPVAAKQ